MNIFMLSHWFPSFSFLSSSPVHQIPLSQLAPLLKYPLPLPVNNHEPPVRCTPMLKSKLVVPIILFFILGQLKSDTEALFILGLLSSPNIHLLFFIFGQLKSDTEAFFIFRLSQLRSSSPNIHLY